MKGKHTMLKIFKKIFVTRLTETWRNHKADQQAWEQVKVIQECSDYKMFSKWELYQMVRYGNPLEESRFG